MHSQDDRPAQAEKEEQAKVERAERREEENIVRFEENDADCPRNWSGKHLTLLS